MFALIAAAAAAAAQPSPSTMQMGAAAEHRDMDCCKDCCKDMAATHDGDGAGQADHKGR